MLYQGLLPTDYFVEWLPHNNTTDALSQDKSNLNMNTHDGYAKCTQLMVSLFHNKGLMYIRNAYLLKLFLHISGSWQKCSSASFEVWICICTINIVRISHMFSNTYWCSQPELTNQQRVKKEISQLPVSWPKAHNHTLTHPPLHRMTLYIFEPQPALFFKSPNPGGCQSTSKRLGCGRLS